MKASFHREKFLIDYFQLFYHEILRQKEWCLRQQHRAPTDVKHTTLEMVQEVQQKLRSLLSQQNENVGFQGGTMLRRHLAEAQYIMVALADEVFLNFTWPGRDAWEDHLLESSVFQTQMAGELFFEKLDALIEASDPLTDDLATLYLLALGLGFRGKYIHLSDESKIHQYRHQLFEIVFRRSPQLFRPNRHTLLPLCYEHILSDPVRKEIPEVHLWGYVFLSVLGIYLFVTYGLWYSLTHDVEAVIRVLLDQPVSFDSMVSGQL